MMRRRRGQRRSSEETVTIGARVPESVRDAADARAAARKITLSAWVAEAIEEKLAREGGSASG